MLIDLLSHIIGHLIYMFTTKVGTQQKEGIFFRDINKYNPELQEFIDRNSPKNVDSQYEKGKDTTTDYKMDAIRFAYKIFAKTHLMLDCDYDYVFWVDADIIFKKTITEKEVIKSFYQRVVLYHL